MSQDGGLFSPGQQLNSHFKGPAGWAKMADFLVPVNN